MLHSENVISFVPKYDNILHKVVYAMCKILNGLGLYKD